MTAYEIPRPACARWDYDDLVRKRQGKSEFRGRIVGFYSTCQTYAGYVVKSAFETNTVQCWPEAVLEDWEPNEAEMAALQILVDGK